MKKARQIFNEAYDQWADGIWRHILFRVYSNSRAEELMQEAFLKFWEYLEKGNQIKNPRALLYHIADHLIIDEKRKKQTESLDRMMEEEGFEISVSGDREIEVKATYSQVMEHLKTLSEEEQHIFMLRYVDDLDPHEIAEKKGRTANSVSVAINRIAKKIRSKFK